MDILVNHEKLGKIEAAVFDFDGTLSKLRAGWEKTMLPMMVEFIPGEKSEVEELAKKYIDESTGIQTIFQMQWIADTVKERGGKPLDPWEYKAEYLKRLMKDVEIRKQEVINGKVDNSIYKVFGGDEFLKGLVDMGAKIYAASGTDEEDVIKEASILGFDKYFTEIRGAKKGSFNCSKEAILRELVKPGKNLLVVGDGKVEIALGRETGALTLGVASNDIIGCNDIDFEPNKYKRLKNAGAHAIVSDFRDATKILGWI